MGTRQLQFLQASENVFSAARSLEFSRDVLSGIIPHERWNKFEEHQQQLLSLGVEESAVNAGQNKTSSFDPHDCVLAVSRFTVPSYIVYSTPRQAAYNSVPADVNHPKKFVTTCAFAAIFSTRPLM